MNPAYVARQLNKYFQKSFTYDEGDWDITDPEIIINDSISVQVGCDYLGVCQTLGEETIKCFPCRKNVKEIIKDLEQIM